MCRPSATSAREPKAIPPPISSTIIAEHSPMTAHARRSLRAWPAPRKTCECWSSSRTASAVTLAVSLEVALHDVDEFVCRLGARLTGTRSASHEVLTDVILDDFRQQAAHGAAARGQQLHDPAAIRILIQRPLDRLDLPTQAAEPIDELGLLANGVCHGLRYTLPGYDIQTVRVRRGRVDSPGEGSATGRGKKCPAVVRSRPWPTTWSAGNAARRSPS